MRIILCVLLAFGLGSCGEDGDAVKNPGNASLSMSFEGEHEVPGLDLKITRMRVWRSNTNDINPGVISLVDTFKVELWYVVSGEEKSRYTAIDNLLMDDAGNLYFEGAAPGTIVYTSFGDRLGAGGPQSYTVTADNALIQNEQPAAVAWDEVTTSGGVTSTVAELLKANELDETPWKDVRARNLAGALITTRTRYIENTDFSTKAKMGCIVKELDGSSNMLRRKLVFGDVELGNVFQDKEGRAVGTGGNVGDDDSLWIPWTDSWYLTSVNVVTKMMRVVRARSTPFYAGRELPKVDSTDTTPRISGMESLIRQCNAAAARVGSSFYMTSLTGTAVGPTLKTGAANSFCQQMVNENNTNANSVRLDAFTGCTFGGLGTVGAGTWNGTAHTGPIANSGSGYTHIEQSSIVDVQF